MSRRVPPCPAPFQAVPQGHATYARHDGAPLARSFVAVGVRLHTPTGPARTQWVLALTEKPNHAPSSVLRTSALRLRLRQARKSPWTGTRGMGLPRLRGSPALYVHPRRRAGRLPPWVQPNECGVHTNCGRATKLGQAQRSAGRRTESSERRRCGTRQRGTSSLRCRQRLANWGRTAPVMEQDFSRLPGSEPSELHGIYASQAHSRWAPSAPASATPCRSVTRKAASLPPMSESIPFRSPPKCLSAFQSK
jgi:hypothetical protein